MDFGAVDYPKSIHPHEAPPPARRNALKTVKPESEKDRRRYAAVEALKLGHGGIDYLAHLLGCDPKTIRQGLQDFEQSEDPAAGRVRKKGADAGR